jgi:hypothetical protein
MYMHDETDDDTVDCHIGVVRQRFFFVSEWLLSSQSPLARGACRQSLY